MVSSPKFFLCLGVLHHYHTTTPIHAKILNENDYHSHSLRRAQRQCENEVYKLSSLLRQCKSEVQKRSLARSAVVSTHYQGKSAAKRRDKLCRADYNTKLNACQEVFLNKKGTFVAFTPFPTVYYNICSFSLMLGSLPVSPSGVVALRDKPATGFTKLHYKVVHEGESVNV